MIEVDGVGKRYGRRTVLEDVRLTVERGGLTSIIGPNGAGKSTLLSIMSRLVRPDSGRVLVDGDDVSTVRGDTLSRRLAVLRQENVIEARLTVEELVAFGRYPHSKGRLTVEDRDHVHDALAYLELTEDRERYIGELSGGQRQRAFVAMVLCQDTDYVLLDEPLNSLDIRHAVAMMRRLRRIADERGKTVVVVLHDINFASCYSDRVVAMRDGRVVVADEPGLVMTPSSLRGIYDVDVRVERIDGHPIGIYYR